MVIITTVSYPPESVEEVAKRFVEQPPLPDYITMKGPYISSLKGEGIQTIALYEFEDQSKLAEALTFVGTRMVTYYGVPGFTYSAFPWLEIQEALKLIGKG